MCVHVCMCVNSSQQTGQLLRLVLCIPHVRIVQDSSSVRWKHSCPKPVFSSPALLLSHDVAFGSVDGLCYVLSSQEELVRRRSMGCSVVRLPLLQPLCAVFGLYCPAHHRLDPWIHSNPCHHAMYCFNSECLELL